MPTFGDETLHDRYEREHADHMARLAKMTPEQIADLELSLHNALAEVDRLRTQAQAAPEAEPYGYLREVDGNIQLSIGPVRPADRSGGFATPWAAIFAAQQHDAELVELLDRIVEHLEYDAIGSPSEAIAGGLAEDLRAKLAALQARL